MSDSVTPMTNGTGSVNEHNDRTDGASGALLEGEGREGRDGVSSNGDGASVLSEKERTEQRLRHLMEQLSVKNAEINNLEERKSAAASSTKGELADL